MRGCSLPWRHLVALILTALALSPQPARAFIITDVDGLPIPGASVAVYRQSSLVAGGKTDGDGRVILDFAGLRRADIFIHKAGFQSIVIESTRPFLPSWFTVELPLLSSASDVCVIAHIRDVRRGDLSGTRAGPCPASAEPPARAAASAAEPSMAEAADVIQEIHVDDFIRQQLASAPQMCRDGYADACRLLGRVTLRGDYGVPSDPVEARRLLARACSLGSAPACADLESLEGREGP